MMWLKKKVLLKKKLTSRSQHLCGGQEVLQKQLFKLVLTFKKVRSGDVIKDLYLNKR